MKTYRVTGAAKTLGHAPGDVFDADLTEGQEARLISRGALEVADEAPQEPEATETETAEEQTQTTDDSETGSGGLFSSTN